MAASIIRGRARLCIPQQVWKTSVRLATDTYYVLIPEIPPDTPETNSLMRIGELPQFSTITPDNVITGCAKLAIEYETRLGNQLDKLKDPSLPKTFESVYEPIEEIAVPLNYAWRTAKHLNYVAGTQGFRDIFQRIHLQVGRAKNERWVSEVLYYAGKEVNADAANLTEFQQRLVQLYLLEGRLNGIELQGNDKKLFIETLRKLSEEKNNFRNKVMICQGLFSHRVDDFSVVKDLPKSLVSMMAEDKTKPAQGPWKVTLQNNMYFNFLEHCSDRTLRWNAWQAHNNRASVNFVSQHLANHKLIETIRMYRQDIAGLLGYSSFAEMSMETKMAGTVENVLNMLEVFKSKFHPLAVEEIKVLQDFADSNGFHDKLNMWDIPFWRRKHHDTLYSIDETEIAHYFPLPKVLDGLFRLCNRFFGINIKENTTCDKWDSHVTAYDVSDENGDYVSTFYLDPYARYPEKIGGAWMEMGKERSDLMGTHALSYLVLNIPPPVMRGRPALMSFKDVASLFHQFGHGLQQMLTKASYSEIAGQRNIEWDALHICASFMVQLLHTPHMLRDISSHHETGNPLSDSEINQIISASKHLSAFDMMNQLYFSAFDMEIHLSKTHWHDVMTSTWESYVPAPLTEDNYHPCSFTHIFSDQYPAAYYSYKWSEMIAADIFDAFHEVGFDNQEKILAVGKRFKDTFLSLGGGVPASEVFRRFRGRDPSLDALQTHYSVK
ncbi:hypothetical protein ScPMuIL_004414 [Solemya velum]